jgi:hypothetical protein
MDRALQSDLRAWVRGHRLAEARIGEEQRRRHLEPSEAFDQLLDLVAFASAQLGWPLPPDSRREAETERVRADWMKLSAKARDAAA